MTGMILIGQYDSPFVRRVAIALVLYEVPFVHSPLSVFGDADAIRSINPLVRVPTLVTPQGLALTDSHVILDYLDGLVPDARALLPRAEPARHQALRIVALACGFGEKAVSLFYENRFHPTPSPEWADRCRMQMVSVLDRLEAERGERPGPFWFGGRIGHADIAICAMLRFAREAHPGLIDPQRFPHLVQDAETLEQSAPFLLIQKPFQPPE